MCCGEMVLETWYISRRTGWRHDNNHLQQLERLECDADALDIALSPPVEKLSIYLSFIPHLCHRLTPATNHATQGCLPDQDPRWSTPYKPGCRATALSSPEHSSVSTGTKIIRRHKTLGSRV